MSNNLFVKFICKLLYFKNKIELIKIKIDKIETK